MKDGRDKTPEEGGKEGPQKTREEGGKEVKPSRNLRLRLVSEGFGSLFEEETESLKKKILLQLQETLLPPSFLRREEQEPSISFRSGGKAPEGGEILEVEGMTLPRPLQVVSTEILLIEAFLKRVFLPLKAEVFLYGEWR